MCGGGGAEKRKAKRKQREADEKAARRQAELDALAAQRSALAASQQKRLKAFEVKSAKQAATNAAQVEQLQQQQAEQVAGIKAAGSAASNSLRILGQDSVTAPTAQTSRSKPTRKGVGTTSAGYSRGSASTRGTNLSI